MWHRTAEWRRLDFEGADRCVFEVGDAGAHVRGFSSGCQDGSHFTARYTLRYDPSWEFVSARIDAVIDWEPHELSIERASAGVWSIDGERNEPFSACTDLALSFSPAAVAACALRLKADPRAAETERKALLLDMPSFELRAVPLSFSRPTGCSLRYEFDGRGAEIVLDSDGLVRSIGDIFAATY